ncbi:MAG: hypothetical protein ABJC51_10460, partial [Acidobacteriota bacterium]
MVLRTDVEMDGDAGRAVGIGDRRVPVGLPDHPQDVRLRQVAVPGVVGHDRGVGSDRVSDGAVRRSRVGGHRPDLNEEVPVPGTGAHRAQIRERLAARLLQAADVLDSIGEAITVAVLHGGAERDRRPRQAIVKAVVLVVDRGRDLFAVSAAGVAAGHHRGDIERGVRPTAIGIAGLIHVDELVAADERRRLVRRPLEI